MIPCITGRARKRRRREQRKSCGETSNREWCSWGGCVLKLFFSGWFPRPISTPASQAPRWNFPCFIVLQTTDVILIIRKASTQQGKRHRFPRAVLPRCHDDPIYSFTRPPNTSLQVVSTANQNLRVRMQTRREKMETCSTSRDRPLGARSFPNQQSVPTPWKKRLLFPMHRREFSRTRRCCIFRSQNG